MIEWRQWLQTFMTLVVLTSLFEMLLPEDDLRKFAKLAMGLVLMLAILQPIMALVHLDWHLEYPLVASVAVPAVDWQERASVIQEAGAGPVMQAATRNVARQIQALLLLDREIHEVSITVSAAPSGDIDVVIVEVAFQPEVRPVVVGDEASLDDTHLSRQKSKLENVRRSVARYLDIDEANVEVRLLRQ